MTRKTTTGSTRKTNRSRNIDDARRRLLLASLQELGSDADAHEDLTKVFLPLPLHNQALKPKTLIVRGERGAGKTALFHVLRQISEENLSFNSFFSINIEQQAKWIEGFSERGKLHPSTDVLNQFGMESHEDHILRAFWFGHLVGVLSNNINEFKKPPSDFLQAWNEHRTEPQKWVTKAIESLGPMTSWLDQLDDWFVTNNIRYFVTYDHLDKIGIFRPGVRTRFASTLLAMWLSFANRYKMLSAKIFLREDLFEASVQGSTDASKLETRSVSLYWSTEDLYRLLIRHIGAVDNLREWLTTGSNKIKLEERSQQLGWFPPDALPEEGRMSQHSFAEKLSGELMGEGVKKGYTHRWIPNHLQDAHGLIVPRPFLNIVFFAAQWALQRGPKAQHSRLLHYTELQAALEKTSQYRAKELAEEHPVVNRLERLRDIVLLTDRRSLVKRLSQPPTDRNDGFEGDGEAVLDELVHLGVLKIRADNRIDVPDIYRFGYGIKRKGGVARPR